MPNIEINEYSNLIGNVNIKVRNRFSGDIIQDITDHNQVTNNLLLGVCKYLVGTGGVESSVPQYLAIGADSARSVSSSDTKLSSEYINPGTGLVDRIPLAKRLVQYNTSSGYSVLYGVTIPYNSHNGTSTFTIRELGLYSDAYGTSSLLSRIILPSNVIKSRDVIIDIQWLMKLIPVSTDNSNGGTR